NDYRYFPCPDLLPVKITEEFVEEIRATLPELPDVKKARFIDSFALKEEDANTLVTNRETAEYFEIVANKCGDARLAANWVTGELSSYLNKEDTNITTSPVTAEMLALLITRIKDNTISGKIAKQVFEALWNGEGKNADAIIESKGLKQITDSGAIEAIVDEIIAANPDQVEQFKAGKEKVMGFFVGQCMKASKGKANPEQLNQLIRDKLK
ncbi:MAG: Asp-tRNA(Asn)/Glu-tRNA(Gln) amidotransferase GatCAB subunit B, partial [Gammaproteobacteria bacterium]|nr:Asp-tRNA(Asn)/Glu-tRNA(Gln) amidotransferase GatCAB subunit B [Gammaproteobacteria bacterium]